MRGEADADRPLVSAIITTWERAELAGRAVRSVLAQTFRDFELIVIDDASRDGTAEVVGSFDDARIRYVRLARRHGVGGARNAGLREARGRWVAILDSDDEWLPAYLERQLARLAERPDAAAVACLCEQVHADTGSRPVLPQGPLPEGDVLDALLDRRRAMTPSALVVERRAMIAVGGFDEEMPSAEDLDLLLKLARAPYRFAAVQEALVLKHEHGAYQIRSDPLARVGGASMLERRWGALARERLGKRGYRRWRKRRRRRVDMANARYLRSLVDRGARVEALGYAVRVLPHARWGGRYALRALVFALFGRALYAKLEAARPIEA